MNFKGDSEPARYLLSLISFYLSLLLIFCSTESSESDLSALGIDFCPLYFFRFLGSLLGGFAPFRRSSSSVRLIFVFYRLF